MVKKLISKETKAKKSWHKSENEEASDKIRVGVASEKIDAN